MNCEFKFVSVLDDLRKDGWKDSFVFVFGDKLVFFNMGGGANIKGSDDVWIIGVEIQDTNGFVVDSNIGLENFATLKSSLVCFFSTKEVFAVDLVFDKNVEDEGRTIFMVEGITQEDLENMCAFCHFL